MAENFVTDGHDGLTHSGIVHKLLDKITTELAVKEFKGGYTRPIVLGGSPYMEYVPDSRAEYIQSIEALTDVLLPKFDPTMTAKYLEYENGLKEIEKIVEVDGVIIGDDKHREYIKRKVKLIRKLFQELNLLLHRTNYLKTAPREEEEDEEEDEE
jgi:hypothetical protein